MVKFINIPNWFLGKDVLIESFSFIVLFLFSFLAIKNYKVNKNRRLFYLGIGFGLIALAQLAAIITKLVLYYDIGPSQAIGQAIVASQILSSVDIFYFAGFFFQRFLTLTGIYLIYRLPRTNKSILDSVLIIYFILISAFVTNNVANVFHLTAFLLLFMIVINYYNIYKKNKFFNTQILMVAFGILALSQLLFIFSGIGIVRVAGNLVELISYTILLGLIIRIQKYGKETKPDGHNSGHVGDNSGKGRKH
jgi:hypothetical protein